MLKVTYKTSRNLLSVIDELVKYMAVRKGLFISYIKRENRSGVNLRNFLA